MHELKHAAVRAQDVLCDAPALQVYTGAYLDVPKGGKDGAVYGSAAGICLESQGFPNAPNTPAFPSVELRPGEEYRHTIVYRFFLR